MNRHILLLFLFGLCLWVVPGYARPQKPMNRHSFAEPRCNWLVRITQTDEFRKHVEMTDEQEKAVSEKLSRFTEESRDVEAKIRSLARQQAMLFKSLVSSDSDESQSEQKIYAIIDQISKLRSQQAKLSVKSMLELRKSLDKEQWKKANNYIRKRNRARMMQRNRANRTDGSMKRNGTGMGNRKFSRNNNGQGCKGRQFSNQDSMDEPVNGR